jgi:hypothetical protein
LVAVRGTELDAVCMNQAHRIARLVPGARGTHALSRLSGITILQKEHGMFDADSLPVLEREVGT